MKCADFADSAAFVVSSSVRKVWIEIEKYAEAFKRVESPSVRKVWTKIRCNIFDLKKYFVLKSIEKVCDFKIYNKSRWMYNYSRQTTF